MLRKHAATLARINGNASLKQAIRTYFGLPECTALTPALYQRGLGQADLVLCLLRLEHIPGSRAFVEELIGHPITVGRACLLTYPRNGSPRVTRSSAPEDRRVTFVLASNPRQPNTTAALRWSEFKVGKTISQLRSRGVTKRDIRRATRLGWIKLEETASATR